MATMAARCLQVCIPRKKESDQHAASGRDWQDGEALAIWSMEEDDMDADGCI
jgi:hypothetical protein